MTQIIGVTSGQEFVDLGTGKKINNPLGDLGQNTSGLAKVANLISNEPQKALDSFSLHYNKNKTEWRFSLLHIAENAAPSTKKFIEFFCKVLTAPRLEHSDYLTNQDILDVCSESMDLWVSKTYQTEVEFRLNLMNKVQEILNNPTRREEFVAVLTNKTKIKAEQIPDSFVLDLDQARPEGLSYRSFLEKNYPLNPAWVDEKEMKKLAFFVSIENNHSLEAVPSHLRNGEFKYELLSETPSPEPDPNVNNHFKPRIK